MNTQLPKGLYSFIWHFVKPHKYIALIFVLLAFCAGFWGPFNSMIIKHIINLLSQSQEGDISLLWWPATLIVLNFTIFDNVTWRSIGYIKYAYEEGIKNKIMGELLNFVLNNSYEFFQNNLSGRIAHQIFILADTIEIILFRMLPDFIRGTSLLIISFVIAYHVSSLFFWIILGWFILFFSFSVSMSKRLVYLEDRYAESESIASGQITDSISNQNNVRLFAMQNFEVKRMNKFLLATRRAFQAKQFFLVFLHSIQGLMIAAMMAGSAYGLVYLYGRGLVKIGDFALILGLSMELGHMMWYTMRRVDEFTQAVGKCKQSLSALLIPSNIRDKPDAKCLNVRNGRIDFRQVTFQYEDAKHLFDNLSVTIDPGQKVGLVGYSGSGKSSFFNLILRLYDVTSGCILIDDQDVRNVTQNSLRRNIAHIPQDPSLFHRSIIDNIRYGNIDASDDQVFDAAKRAHAHEFISTLPQEYSSLVGERGIKLSGGQRQRIAIARAILKNAPILLFDEATSQLDSITERYIQESLQEIMKNKTTIVIAHRLSTLLQMDRILVFDQGKIVQDGTHTELLQKEGLYKILWNAQVNGFLPES